MPKKKQTNTTTAATHEALIGHGRKKCFKLYCVCFPFAKKCEAEKQRRRSPKATRSSVFYDLIWENCCQKKTETRQETTEKQAATRCRLERGAEARSGG